MILSEKNRLKGKSTMTINISERASNLLTELLGELTDDLWEYAEGNGGLPSCVFCHEVAISGPDVVCHGITVPGADKIPHAEDCLTVKALELAKELSQ